LSIEERERIDADLLTPIEFSMLQFSISYIDVLIIEVLFSISFSGILFTLDLAVIFAQIADLAGAKRISFASQFAHNLTIYDSQNPIRLLCQSHIMRD
jgi:hypothetical protein